MRNLFAAVAVLLMATACVQMIKPYAGAPYGGWMNAMVDPEPSMLEAAADAVRSQLKDPESARFIYGPTYLYTDGTNIVCGDVNARNSFGGYTGNTRFRAVVLKSGAKYMPLGSVIADRQMPVVFERMFPEC